MHCDLKAANVLTTKTGNVKLSTYGVSLNLRTMGRDIKDVAGTPNPDPEVIEFKGSSSKSDIWSPWMYGYRVANGMPALWGYRECHDK